MARNLALWAVIALVLMLVFQNFTPRHVSRAVDYSDGNLVVSTSNEALRGWLLDKYGDVLAELANLASGENVRLVVQVAQTVPAGDTPVESSAGPVAPPIAVMPSRAIRIGWWA